MQPVESCSARPRSVGLSPRASRVCELVHASNVVLFTYTGSEWDVLVVRLLFRPVEKGN